MPESRWNPDADSFSSKSPLLVLAIVFSVSGRYTGGTSGGAVSQSVMKKLPSKLALSSKNFFQFSRIRGTPIGFELALSTWVNLQQNNRQIGFVQSDVEIVLKKEIEYVMAECER
jgi:hypothetical protein